MKQAILRPLGALSWLRTALCAAGLFVFSFTISVAAEIGPALDLKKGQSLTGRFTYEHPVQGFDKPIRSEGSFLFAPGEKMVWNIVKPMATTTTVTREGLVQSVGGYPLLTLSPQQMPFIAEVESKLLAALNGDWKNLEADYLIQRKKTPAGWQVTLTPRPTSARQPFQKIVATGQRFVERAEIFLPQSVDVVVFSDQRVAP